MEFRIADTFTDSLARLTGDEQKAVMYLRYLFGWAYEMEEIIPKNPASKLRYRNRARYEATHRISREDLVRLFAVRDQFPDFSTLLIDALMRFLLDTGVRLSEALALNCCHIGISRNQFELAHSKNCVLGPGGFGQATRTALDRYLEVRSMLQLPAAERFFVNSKGTPLTARHADVLLKQVAGRAGVHHVTAHMFRVTSAVEMFLAGADILTVQTKLRHTDPAMTLHYLRLAEQEKVARLSRLESVVDSIEQGVSQSNRGSA